MKKLILRHRLEGYNVPWQVINITNGQRMSVAVEGLLVWKEYEFQVRILSSYEKRAMYVSVFICTEMDLCTV